MRRDRRWASGRPRVFAADTRLIGAAGEEAGRGTEISLCSHIPRPSSPGYVSRG